MAIRKYTSVYYVDVISRLNGDSIRSALSRTRLYYALILLTKFVNLAVSLCRVNSVITYTRIRTNFSFPRGVRTNRVLMYLHIYGLFKRYVTQIR